MHESEAYYEEILYPLQNGVLRTLAACEAPFYLTGGTALHRHYFGFRYSEDLDAATVADLARSFPRHLFDTVRWRERPDEESFFSDLAVIASDLLAVRENSLCRAR